MLKEFWPQWPTEPRLMLNKHQNKNKVCHIILWAPTPAQNPVPLARPYPNVYGDDAYILTETTQLA